MNNDSIFMAICPLFNFEISEVLVGNHTREETTEYFNALRKRIEQGIEILNNVKIRRIKKEDIDRIREFGISPPMAGIFSRINMRTFVIEILLKELNIKKILLKIYKVLLAMRLHRASDIFCKVIWFEKKSKVNTLTMLDSPIPEPHARTRSPHSMEITEFEELKKLANKIDKIDFNERNSLRIACERFSRSYEEHREDEKIIDFMIAFEALFLKGKKVPSKIGLYIGLGCSMLLGKNDKEREEINEFLVKAYNIRNRIVHGSEFITSVQINNETYKIQDFIFQLQKYLRESIKKLV